MRNFLFLPLLLSALWFTGCPVDDDGFSGSSITTDRLAIYGVDVDVTPGAGEDSGVQFSASDSTTVLQITRSVDPDISQTGDEEFETIFIVIPFAAQTLDISGDDWNDTKTFAFTSDREINPPIARVTGGAITGQRLSLDNSWIISGSVELSETFEQTFPTDLTGTFGSR